MSDMNLLDFGFKALSFLNARKQQRYERKMYDRSLKQAQAQFDSQMDESIQRRVKDAQAAGIHPLFALGASSGASPTLSAGRVPTGSGVGDALQKMGEALGMAGLNRARTRQAEAGAARDEAEAGYLNSQKKRLEQDMVSRGHDGASVSEGKVKTGPGEHPDVTFGPPEPFNPPVPTSMPGRPAVESGTRPPYVEYLREDGSKGLAFGQSVPGAEELNAFWIPLQNWWHTSKEARRRIREKLGITTSDYYRARKDPAYAEELVRRNKARIQRMKKEMRNFRKAVNSPRIRN